MSDYADDIVKRAMQHALVLDDAGQPELTVVMGGVVFARCTQGCSVSVGTDVDRLLFRAEEGEMRHRLYAAVTETTEHMATVFRRALTEEQPRPKPGDPCPICGTPMRRMADGSGKCISDHK